MTNTTYTDFPFAVDGVNFVSRIYADSPFLSNIERMPEGVFAQMNQEAVKEIIGNASLFTLAELQDELDRVNDGGSHAFILLGENN